ncbi:hypothetical protein BJ546DRAFT_1068559 [Cryomyces antarcticus]
MQAAKLRMQNNADTTRFSSAPSSWTEFYPVAAWALVKTNENTKTPSVTIAEESEESTAPQTTTLQQLSSRGSVHRPSVPTASTRYRAVSYKEPIHVSFAQGKILTLDNFFYDIKYNGESAAVFAVSATTTVSASPEPGRPLLPKDVSLAMFLDLLDQHLHLTPRPRLSALSPLLRLEQVQNQGQFVGHVHRLALENVGSCTVPFVAADQATSREQLLIEYGFAAPALTRPERSAAEMRGNEDNIGSPLPKIRNLGTDNAPTKEACQDAQADADEIQEDSDTAMVIDLTLDSIVGTTGSSDDIADLRTTSTLIEGTAPSGDVSIPDTLSIIQGGVLVLKDPAKAQLSTVGRVNSAYCFDSKDLSSSANDDEGQVGDDRDDDAAPPADVPAAKLRMQNNVT